MTHPLNSLERLERAIEKMRAIAASPDMGPDHKERALWRLCRSTILETDAEWFSMSLFHNRDRIINEMKGSDHGVA